MAVRSTPDPFAGDPFLEAFDRLPDSQLLKEQQVAALTQISPDWFQKRRAQGRIPPVWVAPTPDLIRYPVGLLRTWLASLLAQANTSPEPVEPAGVKLDPRGRLDPDELAALQLPSLKGGRRKATQASFSSFLQRAAPADAWLFERAGPFGRPIDFIEGLTLDLPSEGLCEWLTLDEYVAALLIASRGEQAARDAQPLDALPPGRSNDERRF